jgi:hypothetical protein
MKLIILILMKIIAIIIIGLLISGFIVYITEANELGKLIISSIFVLSLAIIIPIIIRKTK